MSDHTPRVLFALALLVILYGTATMVGPVLEGKLFPVVVSTKLTRVLPVEGEPDSSIIYGTSRKVRTSCKWRDQLFYYGAPTTNNVPVTIEIKEKPKLRPGGRFGFGPWVIGLNARLIRGSSYSVAVHRCHPFWLTYTHFWP